MFPNRVKTHTTNHLFFAGIALLISLAATHSLAQDLDEDEQESWYQIEVIIFENRSYSAYGPDPEAWSRDIFLAYPLNSTWLLTTEELEEIEAAQVSEENLAGAPIQAADSLDTEEQSQEQAFIDLGKEIQQLTAEKRAISNERNMRVLFHKVWRQAVSTREQTPAVIIQGGNQYDDHFELEGSLLISVSRYLHLDTNIWFTNFEANIEQEGNWWPSLPTPPVKTPEDRLGENDISLLDTKLVNTEAPWDTQSENGSNIRFDLNSDWQSTGQALQDDRRNNYVTREIIKLEQSRRMRSKELHYLDHPKLGLIIRIDNYDRPTEPGAEIATN